MKYHGGRAVCINSGLPGYHRWNPTTYPFLAMEVNDLPPGYRFSPSNNTLIDDILEPMVEGKPTPYGKEVKTVENFYSSCPSELDGAKAILENEENSLHLFVRRNRMSKNGKKVSRAAKGGYWRARGGYEGITTESGIKAKKGVYEYTPKHKSEECVVKWIMEEYVLDRGEKFEDYALCKLRVARSGKRKKGKEPSTSGKRKKRANKDADNAAEEKDSSRHEEGLETNPLPIQTNPPWAIENCSQETFDTLNIEDFRPVLEENGIYMYGRHEEGLETNPLPIQTNPPWANENCGQETSDTLNIEDLW